MNRLGFIDGRRPVIGGMPGWTGVPGLLIPGQLQAFGILEEFLKSTELAAGETPTGWETDVFGGGGTFTIADELGGVGLWQTAGADHDAIQSTLGSIGIGGGAFWPQAGRDIWFEARVKLSHIEEIIVAIGLQDPNAAVYMGNAGAGPAVQNHLLFTAVDAGAGITENWHFEGDRAGTDDDNDLEVALVALPTYVTLGFHVVGVTRVDVYVNRVLISGGQVLTASIPITGLMPVVCLKAGAAEVQAFYADYHMDVQRR